MPTHVHNFLKNLFDRVNVSIYWIFYMTYKCKWFTLTHHHLPAVYTTIYTYMHTLDYTPMWGTLSFKLKPCEPIVYYVYGQSSVVENNVQKISALSLIISSALLFTSNDNSCSDKCSCQQLLLHQLHPKALITIFSLDFATFWSCILI